MYRSRSDAFWNNLQTLGALRAAFQRHASIAQACAHASISERSYYDFKKKFPTVALWVERGKKELEFAAKNIIATEITEKQSLSAAWELLNRVDKSFVPKLQQRLADADGEKLDLPDVVVSALDKIYGPKDDPAGSAGGDSSDTAGS